jgi:hypothetical protein
MVLITVRLLLRPLLIIHREPFLSSAYLSSQHDAIWSRSPRV